MEDIKKFEDFLDRMQGLLDEAKKQGHIIVQVKDLENAFPELMESDDKNKPNGGIVMEDFNDGNGFYKVNIAYLNEEQVKEIEKLVKKWNPELKESEGEKTKRLLHTIANKMSQHLRDIFTEEEFQCFDAWSNAWLEKQGEQKPILDVEIPFGAKDSELEEVSYNIPKGYHAEIEDNKVVIKKGEQKFAEWNKNDEVLLDETLHFIREFQQSDRCINEGDMQNSVTCKNWLKFLKERVQPRQEWSEEDEREVDILKAYICSREWSDSHIDRALGIVDELVKKLKSLRPQSTWKPSDEQMEYLAKAITTLGDEGDCKTALILNDLRFELKKLKGE